MRTFTASIELDADQAELVRITATYFRMDVQTFLAEALISGIAHAEERMEYAAARASMNLSEELDDGMPF
jgi:hypothetical protein